MHLKNLLIFSSILLRQYSLFHNTLCQEIGSSGLDLEVILMTFFKSLCFKHILKAKKEISGHYTRLYHILCFFDDVYLNNNIKLIIGLK